MKERKNRIVLLVHNVLHIIMKNYKSLGFLVIILSLTVGSCSDISAPTKANSEGPDNVLSVKPDQTGALTANGWYEGVEIYYIHNGIEEGVTSRGENDIYLIGGDRLHQANVVEFIPGEAGYSPHWNVYVVHTAEGKTVQDIIDAGYASTHYSTEGVLFDDVEDLRSAKTDGLVIFDRPGIVVNCPIISEHGADSPGNRQLSEVFEPFGTTF